MISYKYIYTIFLYTKENCWGIGDLRGKKFGRKVKIIFSFLLIAFLMIQILRTLVSHFIAGEYSSKSWEIVWPVIVSTMIAVLGTLVTSYVFLKDTLDRTINEKPYYAKVIGEYRQEKIKILLWYSVMFVGISCYLMLFQNVNDGNSNFYYDLFLYVGILAVASILILSIHFLYQCINIDRAICKIAESLLERLDKDIENVWMHMGSDRTGFFGRYIDSREDSTISEFLDVSKDDHNNSGKNKEETGEFDEEKFVIRFSEWEKFILAFLEKSDGFHYGQDTRQKIIVAAGDIERFEVIQQVEYDDAESNDWGQSVYLAIQRYRKLVEKNMSLQNFLHTYQLLSDYRDILQVKQDNVLHSKLFEKGRKSKTIKENGHILYMFFWIRFYSFTKCLSTLPKIEIFYPLAKLNTVDLYNVRFENSSFRASSFNEVIFARTKMVGTNMALSKFIDCNFYNADIRNCALGNALFEKCLMTEMILSDVDVTGTNFVEVDLRESTFENAVIVNVEFHKSILSNVNFIDCKLSQIDFYDIVKEDLKYSNFEKSILKDICFPISPVTIEIPERYHDCDRNYFKKLGVKINSEGLKEREKSDIWDNINDKVVLDMSFSSFTYAVAERIDFRNMLLHATLFTRANLQKSNLQNLCMKGCIMDGVNLTEAAIKYVDMESCVLTGAVLYKAKLQLVNLQNSNLLDCHASESVWTCCMLDKSDISKIDLTKSLIKYSSYRDTILKDAEFTHAHFMDVIFENCNGIGMLSSYSYFENCNFVNALLADSNFNYTIFKECDMSLANLADSTIQEAEFVDCEFENSNFRGCCFIQVTFNNNKNISEEIFEGSTFIRCLFEGSNKEWKKIFSDCPDKYRIR